jgi:hypothetical protein
MANAMLAFGSPLRPPPHTRWQACTELGDDSRQLGRRRRVIANAAKTPRSSGHAVDAEAVVEQPLVSVVVAPPGPAALPGSSPEVPLVPPEAPLVPPEVPLAPEVPLVPLVPDELLPGQEAPAWQ